MSNSKKRRKIRINPEKKGSSHTSSFPKWLLIVAGLALVVLISFGITTLIQNNATVSANPDEISVDQAFDKYESGTFLLDVRTQEEWEEFHIPKTTLIPVDELESRLSEVPPGQEIVVVCRSGNRSQVGRDILHKAGFDSVSSMAGGLKQWKASGYPTVSGP